MIGCSRTIQKQVEVNDAVGRVFNESVRPMITSKCLEKSISKEELNKLLSKGVKVITVNEYSYDITYKRTFNYYGTCFNKSYILEGPKKILENL